MTLHRKPLALLLLIGFGHALAAAPAPDLPPDEVVARVRKQIYVRLKPEARTATG